MLQLPLESSLSEKIDGKKNVIAPNLLVMFEFPTSALYNASGIKENSQVFMKLQLKHCCMIFELQSLPGILKMAINDD